jgi:hypothetical protein
MSLRRCVAVCATAALLLCATARAGEGASARKGRSPRAEALIDQARTIQRQVADLLGVESGAPVAVEVIERAEALGLITAEFDRHNPPEEVRNSAFALRRLGLLPPDYALRAQLLNLVATAVGGFYLPRTDTFYLIADMPLQAMITAHELTHALQDRAVDLQHERLQRRDNTDAGLAYTAMLEGQAMVAMSVYMREHQGAGALIAESFSAAAVSVRQQQALNRSPPFVREMLVWPYMSGQRFVLRQFVAGRWARIWKSLRNPPASTEQILHPAKFLHALDRPTRLAPAPFDSALDEEWTRVDEDTLGEFVAGQILRLHRSGNAAPGWDGDALLVYRRAAAPDASEAGPPPRSLVWASTWDRPASAARYADAFAEGIADRFGPSDAADPEGGLRYRGVDRGGRRVALWAKDAEILYLDGFAPADEGALHAAWIGAIGDRSLYAADHRADGKATTPVPAGPAGRQAPPTVPAEPADAEAEPGLTWD